MRCLQVTKAISERREQPLTLRQQIAVEIHLLMCPYCRQFEKNCEKLSQLMKKFQE